MMKLKAATALTAALLIPLSSNGTARAVSPHEARLIHGTVVTTERTPLSGATVELAVYPTSKARKAIPQGGTIERTVLETTTTDLNGGYSFAAMTPEAIQARMNKGVFNFEVRVRQPGKMGFMKGGLTQREDGTWTMALNDSGSLDIEMMDDQSKADADVPASVKADFAKVRKDSRGCHFKKLVDTTPRWSRVNTSYVTHAGADYWYTYGEGSKTSLDTGAGAGYEGYIKLSRSGGWYETTESKIEFPKRSVSWDASTMFTMELVNETCFDTDSKRWSFWTHEQPGHWVAASAAARMPTNANAPHCVDETPGASVTLKNSYGRIFSQELNGDATWEKLTVEFKVTSSSDYSTNNTLKYTFRKNMRLCGTHGDPSDKYNPRNLQATA